MRRDCPSQLFLEDSTSNDEACGANTRPSELPLSTSQDIEPMDVAVVENDAGSSLKSVVVNAEIEVEKEVKGVAELSSVWLSSKSSIIWVTAGETAVDEMREARRVGGSGER